MVKIKVGAWRSVEQRQWPPQTHSSMLSGKLMSKNVPRRDLCEQFLILARHSGS